MEALIRIKPGKEFSSMKMGDISTPLPGPNELQVKMVSSRINPVDMDLMKGFPSLKYKNPQIGGIDGAGIVTSLGKNVKGFNVGDKVFFYRLFSDIGTWAETITIPSNYCAKIPDSLSTESAGSIALPLLTAYDSLTQLNPLKGQWILIHGAGGGVGFLAVQIAKKMGLFVIGTAGENDKEALLKIGLDKFIDFRKFDFESILKQGEVDLVLDVMGDSVLRKSILLKPKKVISLKLPDTEKMKKAGVELPGILKFLMKLMTSGIRKLAKKNGVELIGQITGANGSLLQSAVNFLDGNLITRPFESIDFVGLKDKALSKSDIGKVIVFQL